MPEKVDIQIDVDAKDLNKLDSSLGKVEKSVKKVGKETKKTKTDVSELGNQLDNVSGGAITKFKGFTGVLKGVTTGFKTLRGAIIGTGIGALVIAVVALTQAFTSSEEGQNKFAKILKQIGVIAGNVGDIIGSLGKVLISVFVDRDLKKAGAAFDEFKERITNFGEETQREIELAGELADKIADANARERELLIERAKTNVEINKLKTKAAEVDKFTSEQRIKFLTDAAALEDEITGKEVDLARLRRDIKIEENSLSESTKEDLDEEARLIAEVIRLQEQQLIRNKELLGVAAGLRKAEADKKKAERDAEIAEFKKTSETINQIQARGIEKQKITVANLSNLKKKAAKEEQEIDKVTTEQKLALSADALGTVSALFGQNSKAGKAAGIAQALINSYLGFTQVLASPSTIPEPFGSIQKGISAAAVLASGLQTVRQITAVQTPAGGGGATANVSGPRGASTPPAFNVVGANPTNQLAEALGENETKPVRAFVVSSEITTQQSLDRKIEAGASLG